MDRAIKSEGSYGDVRVSRRGRNRVDNSVVYRLSGSCRIAGALLTVATKTAEGRRVAEHARTWRSAGSRLSKQGRGGSSSSIRSTRCQPSLRICENQTRDDEISFLILSNQKC